MTVSGEFEADIVLKDQHSDLAVLRLKDTRERFAAIDLGDSDALQVGDIVLALGNPFGVGQTVTHGIVSAVARTQVGITDYQFFIQTDAAINPGNSGGALVSLDGRLIGINTAIYSQNGGSVGIGFATPSNIVTRMVSMGDIYATIYKAFGIDWTKTYMTPIGRPIYIANALGDKQGEPIKELV